MKKSWYLFFLLFIISIILVLVDWSVDGFNFFEFQEPHFYFQSWISMAGSAFTFVMAIVIFIIFKKSQLQSLKYIPLSFLLLAIAYAIIGYHASYCKVCSDLGLCAASHNYPLFLNVIAFIIFILIVIMFNRSLDTVKKTQFLFKFSFGIIIATVLLMLILFASIKHLEVPDQLYYLDSVNNLQAFIFLFPVIIIIWVFIYFRKVYKASWIYLLIAFLLSLSYLPQFLHIYTCKECHIMECSEFYIFSVLFTFIATGLFIHSIYKQLQKDNEEI